MPQQIAEEIRARNAEFEKLFADNKLQDLVDRIYTDDCKFMPYGIPAIIGRQGVLEIFADERKTLADALTLNTVEVNSFGEYAYEHGNYEFKKESVVIDNGKYLVIWKRVDGEWRIKIDIFNSDRPF